jgi:GAF domain-containing protein
MKTPVPENEAARLRTLQLYRILDTASEKCLDDLVSLAGAICEAPISLISLIDENRQWFKSRVGIESTETPRDIAFCAFAIMNDDLFIVEDATKDARFASNPLVTADPAIRFYAGAPLVVEEGMALGTLCVIDRLPRTLTLMQKKALKVLGESVVTLLKLRRAQEFINAAEHVLPMCVRCNSIRDNNDTWHSLQHYVTESVQISHGLCPDCVEPFFAKTK